MNASTILSKDFIKSIVGFLTKSTDGGVAVTRPDLAKEIRKQYGRKLDYTDLNMWLSSSVNLGLFDTDDAKFRTKRGVGGGIVRVGSAPAPKKAPKARKPRAAKAAPVTQAAPVVAPPMPEAQPTSEPIAQA